MTANEKCFLPSAAQMGSLSPFNGARNGEHRGAPRSIQLQVTGWHLITLFDVAVRSCPIVVAPSNQDEIRYVKLTSE